LSYEGRGVGGPCAQKYTSPVGPLLHQAIADRSVDEEMNP